MFNKSNQLAFYFVERAIIDGLCLKSARSLREFKFRSRSRRRADFIVDTSKSFNSARALVRAILGPTTQRFARREPAATYSGTIPVLELTPTEGRNE